MTTDLAIYDMDRTVTRRPTYTPFLSHCGDAARALAVMLSPFVIGSMLAYLAEADRPRAAQGDQLTACWSARVAPARAGAAGRQDFADRAGRDQHPGRRPRAAIAATRRRGGGWCWRPPPTGFYAAANRRSGWLRRRHRHRLESWIDERCTWPRSTATIATARPSST